MPWWDWMLLIALVLVGVPIALLLWRMAASLLGDRPDR